MHPLQVQANPCILFYADTKHVSGKLAKQRHQEILKEKHLRDIIKKQEGEFKILQAEAQRLRSRTFPDL